MRLIRPTLLLVFLSGILCSVSGQDYNSINDEGQITQARRGNRESNEQDKKAEIPRGLKVWTVDDRFGDITPAEPDTASYMFMNTIFTTGKYGEYNTTGNLGAIRQNRIFTDRPNYDDFIFNHGYDYFITQVSDFHFTNTYSPITNASLNSCGNRTNGEDHFKALFAVNAGKRLGVGFKFDYLYGRSSMRPFTARTSATATKPISFSPPIIRNRPRTEVSPTTTTSPTLKVSAKVTPRRKCRPCWRGTGTGTTTCIFSTHIDTVWDSTAKCP